MVRSIIRCVLVAAISLAAVVPLAAQETKPSAIGQTDTLDNAPEIQRRVASAADSTKIDTAIAADSTKIDTAIAADSTKIDTAIKVEIQRWFNDLRSELLDDRAESITWWLASITVLFAAWGIVIAIGGLIGFKEFRELRDEARRRVEAIEREHGRASEFAEQSEKYRDEAMKSAKTLEEQVQTTQDGDRLEETREAGEVVVEVGDSPEASPLGDDIAEAYMLERSGDFEAAIDKWRSIATTAENIDIDLAARAWILVGYLLRKKDEQENEEGGTK